MNESSSYINNSFNLASFSSPSLGGPNMTASYSTSHLNINAVSCYKGSTFMNNTNSPSLTDNLNQHSSQLNLNLNLINRQMSNMLLNTKNVLSCNKKNHFVMNSFYLQFEGKDNIHNRKDITKIKEENEMLKNGMMSLQKENCLLMEENRKLKNEIMMLSGSLVFKQRNVIENGNDLNTTRNLSFLNEMNGGNGNSNNNNTIIMNESYFTNEKEKMISPLKGNKHLCQSGNRYNTIDSNVNLYTKKTVMQHTKKVNRNSITIKEMNTFKENITKHNNVNNVNKNIDNVIRNSIHFNSLCPSNRINNKGNTISLLNPSLSTTKLHNKTAYQIIEKKVSLSQKKISLDNNNNNNLQQEVKTYTKSKTPKTLSLSKEITLSNTTPFHPKTNIIQRQQQQINLLSKDNEHSSSIQFLYKLDIKSNSIIIFNTSTKSFQTLQYQLETASFPALYEEEGTIFLTTNKGLYIITGGTYKSFYFYSRCENTIKKLSSLKNNHCKGTMILYNNKYILCISGCENSTVEQYDIDVKHNWKELGNIDEPRIGCGCFIVNTNMLYVLYGYNWTDGRYCRTIGCVDLNENEWKWRYINVKGSILKIKDFVIVKEGWKWIWGGKGLLIGGNGEDGKNWKTYDICVLGRNEIEINEKEGEASGFEERFDEGMVIVGGGEKGENWGVDSKGNVFLFDVVSGKFKCYIYE